jgi:bacterioferritin
VLRYKRHYYTATGIHAQAVAEEFLEHAGEEQEHADMIAERITQLDGDPDFNPATLAGRSHSEYVEGTSLADMIREDLVAERIAIESYNEIVRYLGDNDTTSRRVMEKILAKEEEHADDLRNLIQTVSQAESEHRSRTNESLRRAS